VFTRHEASPSHQTPRRAGGGRRGRPRARRLRGRRPGRHQRAARTARQQDLVRDLRHRRHGRLRPVLRRHQQASGGDRVVPHLGLRLPGLDRPLADGPGAADDPHHHRRQQRRPRADLAAVDRPGRRRQLPDPPQQAVRLETDARLHQAARRAQPLPQRLRRLRLRRRPEKRQRLTPLVQTRLPPHLRDRPRWRQPQRDQPASARSRPPRPHRQRRRSRQGSDRCRLEPVALRFADLAEKPAFAVLARQSLGRLVGHRLLRRLSRMGRADPPLPALP